MDRRTIIATAGAITLTVLAGSAAIAANVGILGSGSKTPVGQLSPVANVETSATSEGDARVRSGGVSATTSTLPAQVETIYVEEYVPASPGTSGAGDPAAATPAPAAPVSIAGDDDDGAGDDDGAVSEPAADNGGSEAADDQDDGNENEAADESEDDEGEDEYDEQEDEEDEDEEDEDEEYEGGEDDD